MVFTTTLCVCPNKSVKHSRGIFCFLKVRQHKIARPHGFLSVFTAAISLLKRLLEPDPKKRPNIHQVMADPWLQLGNPHTGVPYLNRLVT